ncbi:hypothetical protein D1AOALGA4SA_1228 [Olavius algarvensis Delta 1 endosymbiont]|nr:hypothetical protein D1AOALGA4SA_1228 [Olavius algarvensis Delta 1 endosymbiont]
MRIFTFMRPLYKDVTDPFVKSDRHPLCIPNIPLFHHSIIPVFQHSIILRLRRMSEAN